VIRLEFEARPRIWVEAANESEEERLLDWLNAHEALADIVCGALEVGDEVEGAF
jgi:hypothetical protein